VGRSGQLLTKLVGEELGMERSEFYIANIVKCRPPENRNPKTDEIAACWPWIEEQLRIIDPAVVITLGNFSTQTLLKTKVGITKLRDQVHPFGHRWIVPTFHPAAALRSGITVVEKMRSDLQRAKLVIAGDIEKASA